MFFTDEADGHAADVEDYASALSQQNKPWGFFFHFLTEISSFFSIFNEVFSLKNDPGVVFFVFFIDISTTGSIDWTVRSSTADSRSSTRLTATGSGHSIKRTADSSTPHWPMPCTHSWPVVAERRLWRTPKSSKSTGTGIFSCWPLIGATNSRRKSWLFQRAVGITTFYGILACKCPLLAPRNRSLILPRRICGNSYRTGEWERKHSSFAQHSTDLKRGQGNLCSRMVSE